MSTESAPAAAPAYTFKNPFPARHTVNLKMTGPGSNKDTRHHEISLAGSGITYLAGDALGLMSSNCEALVEELLVALHAKGDEPVPGRDGQPKPLRDALLHDYAITHADRKFVEACAQRGALELAALLPPENVDEFRKYIGGIGNAHDYVEILTDFPMVRFTPEEFVKLLGKMKPRLYSIASSLAAHPDEVHLTVATVTYEIRGRVRKGVASTFLADRWAGDQTAGVWVQNQQKHFSLPGDGATPMIMVGPGTGVAPFRAFVEERLAHGATGANWLFFGEQHAATDYFYREQFTGWVKDGALRLDTAFSRDQSDRIYVQHRMRENAHDIWKWIDGGAEFFVCGDKARMAEDVHQELIRIVASEGGKTPEAAQEYVETMRKTKRYKRDVY
jgi:sulfite reductase (NADPH) flavoprotein alpha-component